METLKRWLAPPVFEGDEEKTRTAALLNLIGLTTIALILAITVGTVFGTGTPTRVLILDLFAALVMVQFLRWLRSGRVQLACAAFVVFGLVFITGATASLGTVRTPTTSIFVFWVFMTGALYELRGVLFGSVAASLAVLGLIVAENAGWLPAPYPGAGFTQWVTFTAVFGFTSGLTYYIVLRTRGALALAEREIEQRSQVEAQLKDSEQRYRTLVEWTPEALVVYRADKILFANPAAVELVGATSAHELLGTSLLDWVHPEYRDALLARRANPSKIESDPRMQRLAEKLVRVDGRVIDVEFMIRTIEYDGTPARQASLRDITERKAASAALEAARFKAEKESRAKSRFLASASHDLRQPAHAAGMFVARLAELPHDAQTRQLISGVEASVHAMQDMLDGFFDVARLESGQIEISRLAFPIDGIFVRLRENFAEAARAKGLRLRFRSSRDWVESDPALLHRILLNLVSNAIRYTPHGTVLVACRPARDGKQLRIEVRDSGVGIAPEHHENVFQEFFQVDNPQRNRAQGLGVGLNIVQRACGLLNHPLALRSALGCGTRLTLTVPRTSPRAGGSYEDARQLASKTQFKGLRVGLIEDDALGRAGLASLLRSWGCSVSEFEGAQAACDWYRQEQEPDLIISDFRLGGGIDGIEAVDLLRIIAGRRILACLISGDTDASVKQQAQAAGLSLLQKPVRPAKLRSLLNHLIQSAAVG